MAPNRPLALAEWEMFHIWKDTFQNMGNKIQTPAILP